MLSQVLAAIAAFIRAIPVLDKLWQRLQDEREKQQLVAAITRRQTKDAMADEAVAQANAARQPSPDQDQEKKSER